jgi:cation:H+ antiporter
MALWTIASLFLLCTLAIVITGSRLAYYGDVIAERSGLGQAWVGVIAMASVTSLPELVTGVTASLIGAPEIAVGDIVGSCLFNLLLLGALDLASPTPLLNRLRPVHTLSAALGALLLCLLAISVLTAPRWPALGWIGWSSPLLFGVYLLAVRALFLFEHRHDQVTDENLLAERYADLSLRTAVWRYLGAAVLLVIAAANLPPLAVQLAEATGLAQGFVGTAFVALSTSLPEIVVSLTAMRLGAWDLAAANVLGSNLFNVAIVAIDDLAFTGGPLLLHVSNGHAVTALGAATMSIVVIAGLVVKPKPLAGRFTMSMMTLLAIYLVTTWLAF